MTVPRIPRTVVRAVMQLHPPVCHPSDPVAEAVRLMDEWDCGMLPVVDPGTRGLVGSITDRDICIAAYHSDAPVAAIPVGAVMTWQAVSIYEDDPIDGVHAAMRSSQIRRVPIVDIAARVVGLITLEDLARWADGLSGPQGDHERSLVAETLIAVSQAAAVDWRARAGRGEESPANGVGSRARGEPLGAQVDLGA